MFGSVVRTSVLCKLMLGVAELHHLTGDSYHLHGNDYHGPRNYYVNNSQGNNFCSCNCNLAAKIIL